MIRRWLNRGDHHVDRAREVDAQRERVEAQWDEVRESVAWARGIRDRNHLTELFYAGRPRGSKG